LGTEGSYLIAAVGDENDNSTTLALKDIDDHKVDKTFCFFHANKHLPTSYITSSIATGSRTIVHLRDLPELSFDKFQKAYDTILSDRHKSRLHGGPLDWIHFEGRDPEIHLPMIQYAFNKRGMSRFPIISVEIEKTIPKVMSYVPFGDVVFISKDYIMKNCADSNKLQDPTPFCRREYPKIAREGSVWIVGWGSKGAFAYFHNKSQGEKIFVSPAFPPPQLKDSIGAGDTMIGAFIHKCLQLLFEAPFSSSSLPPILSLTDQCLQFSCRVAGHKCGGFGFDHVSVFNSSQTTIPIPSKL